LRPADVRARALRHESIFYVTTFSDLGLAEPLLKALAAEGYTEPTPIQAKSIPIVASGRDLLGIAQTGTGKTAAFALPILHRLATDRRAPQHKGCRALILSPTRELATQIAESFRTYGRLLDMKVAVVFGGVGHRPQQVALSRGVDVLVATPGRLLDHVGERNVNLSGTEIFVLDEADQMLDLGFVKPIRRIVSLLAHKRQNLFFSATMPQEIGTLAGELLVSPQKVEIAPASTTVERVAQRIIHVEQSRKRALLVELFADPALSRTLVFTRTKRGADRVAEHLERAGIAASAIHGNKSQSQRERALESFRQAKTRVLVATDIAARGIDIDLVSHVVNFELPEVPEQYVHRIGRTGRAGASGIAISLCDNEERSLLRDIERLTRQRIAEEDRRGDTTLVETAVAPRRQGRDRPQSGGNRRGDSSRGERSGDRKAAPRGDRSGSSAAGAHRGDRRGEHRRGDDRRDAPRGDRGERGGAGRDAGPMAAGGWSPTFDEPVMMLDAQDGRDGGHRGQRNGHHSERGHGERRNGHRPEQRGDERRREGHRGDRPARAEHRGGGASRWNERDGAGPRSGGDRRPERNGETRSDVRGDARGGHRGGPRGEARASHHGEARNGQQRLEHSRPERRGEHAPARRGGGHPAHSQGRHSETGRPGRSSFKADR
jgi:ATP-dependent RNA helicase RhlE